jgi:hypothetical protein
VIHTVVTIATPPIQITDRQNMEATSERKIFQ